MLNGNNNGAKRERARKWKRKLDAEVKAAQAACVFLHRRHMSTHCLVPTFCKVLKCTDKSE